MKLSKQEGKPKLARGAIFAVDWAKESRKRTVYLADLSSRVVKKIFLDKPWTLARVLDMAATTTTADSAIIAFDVPLGLPQSFFDAVSAIPSWRSPSNFVDFLNRACERTSFYAGTTDASQWTIDHPFFSVPPGNGGLKRYIDAAAKQAVDLYRDIDRLTGAKSVFIKSGVPGSVGSAACALWQEIGPLLNRDRMFRIWPFEGALQVACTSAPIVLAEMYPRSAYATALLDAEPEFRPTLIVAKTKRNVRCAAIERLRAAGWVRDHGVTIENWEDAEANEDDFDALMTAAALLRCELDRIPLHRPCIRPNCAEGGILGTASLNLDLPARTFNPHSHSNGRSMSGSRSEVTRNAAEAC